MPPGLIASVSAGSLAERLGLRPSDQVVSINGHCLRDVVDVRFYGADDHLALRVSRNGSTLAFETERRYDEPLGLHFADPTFDSMRGCNNRCEFCFLSQMPPGLRASLYVRDDDYRYSFLFGSFITLTNLDESDWQRIGQQHLSPLYVSVHATEPGLRRRVLGNPCAPGIVPQLRRLGELGIWVHTQVVAVPDLNDGTHLDRTIGDLASLYPVVRSVSVVPVGLTRYSEGDCRGHTDEEVMATSEQVMDWQRRLRERLGVAFAYLADEWHLRLGNEVPQLAAYDGLGLAENGVGLVRRFLDTWVGSDLQSLLLTTKVPVTMATGELFAPVLRRVELAESAKHGAIVKVLPVQNRFFGGTVTVAGLLTGRDVVDQLRGRELGDLVVLPAVMFGGPQGQSLDEMLPREVGEALGRPVVVAGPTTVADSPIQS